jgi:hypothetical protein
MSSLADTWVEPIFGVDAGGAAAASVLAGAGVMEVAGDAVAEAAHRNPMSKFLSSGAYLLRMAERTYPTL